MHAIRPFPSWRLIAAALLSIVLAAPAAAQEPSGEPPREDEPLVLDVPYVPTPNEAVYRMLELAEVQADDYVIDLGSGDGRIVIAAARDWGVKRALGIEIDPERIAEANEGAKEAGVEDRVRFERGNLYEIDFSEVDVLTMYLLPSINLDLRPIILETLRPGTRVVSHAFDMGDWRPDRYIQVQGRYVYYWVVPARVEGTWEVMHTDGSSFSVEIKQTYQRIEGIALIEGRPRPLMFADLHGDTIRFSLENRHYAGQVDGERITPLPGNKLVTGWHAKRI